MQAFLYGNMSNTMTVVVRVQTLVPTFAGRHIILKIYRFGYLNVAVNIKIIFFMFSWQLVGTSSK